MQSSRGKKPSFSLVFVSSKYNSQIDKVVKGINKIIGFENWIGCTTDKEINSVLGYCEGTIEVLCIYTKFMHFGIGISENYRKNPVEEGRKATLQAIENCPVDRSKFATTLFMRSAKKSFIDLTKNPPYFVLTLVGGTYFKNKKAIPGMESEFLEGIKEVTGPFIPIIGASASSNAEEMLNYKGENYVLANGKYYKEGAVVCFGVSDLYFSYGAEHAYIQTNKYGTITKISKNGRIIEEINNKPAVDEYCKLAGIKKTKFLKASLEFQCVNPIQIFDTFGNIYPVPCGTTDGKTLFSYQKLSKNLSINIGKYDENKSVNATVNTLKEIKAEFPKTDIGFLLLFSCIGRRIMLKEKVHKVINKINTVLNNAPYVGFYTNGEIGSKKNSPPRYNNFTDTFFVVFDKIMVE